MHERAMAGADRDFPEFGMTQRTVAPRSRSMKICIACTHGGHLAQALAVADAFQGHDVFVLTHPSASAEGLQVRMRLVPDMLRGPLAAARGVLATLRVIAEERPHVVFSTGAEVAIVAAVAAKLLGDHAMDRSQTQARCIGALLGGEEGIKDPSALFVIHADAGVLHA